MTHALDQSGCPITVYTNVFHTRGIRCRRPLAPGVYLCAEHEADRVRLGGAG